jgi:hypothetical protein
MSAGWAWFHIHQAPLTAYLARQAGHLGIWQAAFETKAT